MILSFGMNGPNESSPSLLITWREKDCIEAESFDLLALCVDKTYQTDFMLFFHDEELFPFYVEVGTVQHCLQRDQTHNLRADHWQIQILDRETYCDSDLILFRIWFG